LAAHSVINYGGNCEQPGWIGAVDLEVVDFGASLQGAAAGKTVFDVADPAAQSRYQRRYQHWQFFML
jgi:hypothetical protein